MNNLDRKSSHDQKVIVKFVSDDPLRTKLNERYSVSISVDSKQLSMLLKRELKESANQTRFAFTYKDKKVGKSLTELAIIKEEIITLKFEQIKYACGEIWISPRLVNLYYHAYLITKTDAAGRVLQIIELDPYETLPVPPTKVELIQGVQAKPRCSDDPVLIDKIFSEPGLEKYRPGLECPIKIAEMNARKDLFKDKTLTYRLKTSNCQHFATFIRDGEGSSFEGDAIDRAFGKSVQATANTMKPFYEKIAKPALSYQPFDNGHTLGMIANWAVWILIFVLLIVFFCLCASLSFSYNMVTNYIDERDKHMNDLNFDDIDNDSRT